MKTETKQFVYLTTEGASYKINMDKPGLYILPVLWNMNGMFRVISLAQIKNLVREYEDQKKGPNPPKSNVGSICYSEAAPISAYAAQLFIG